MKDIVEVVMQNDVGSRFDTTVNFLLGFGLLP